MVRDGLVRSGGWIEDRQWTDTMAISMERKMAECVDDG